MLLVEDIAKENLAEIDSSELHNLRLRAQQVWEKSISEEDLLWKYKLLKKELAKRKSLIKSNYSIDDRLAQKEDPFYIKVLGNLAQLYSDRGNHFSLLVHSENENFIIDPAVKKKEVDSEIDSVIVTQADEDHWKYLSSYGDLPVYSVGGVLDLLPEETNKKPFLKPIQFGNVTVRPIPATVHIDHPAIGVRIDLDDHKISILPEFLKLGKREKDLIKDTYWVVGVGDYEEDDEDKLSFKSLMELAGELEPRKVYLTNVRENILNHKSEVNKELQSWNGRILSEGDVLGAEEFRKDIGKSRVEFWDYSRPAYRNYTFSDLWNTPHFDPEENPDDKIVVGTKFNGVRLELVKKDGGVTIMTNPKEVKEEKHAYKSDRLPSQVKELENIPQDNFRLDCEAVGVYNGTAIHRTSMNALLNGKEDPTWGSEHTYLFVFDILEFNGEDVRSYSLKERYKLLDQFKDSDHIVFIRPVEDLKKDALSYIVKLGDKENIKKAADKIMGKHVKIWYQELPRSQKNC